MAEREESFVAWQEDDPARTVPAPDQPMADVVSDDQGQILFLTDDGRVYLSTLSSGLSSGRLQELALPCQCVIAVAAAEKLSRIIFVTDRGRLLRSAPRRPWQVEEFDACRPRRRCSHGVTEESPRRLAVRQVAANDRQVLLVSDRGRLWLLDVDESAETAPTPQAKWLAEFRERHVLTVACGADFSAVLVQDQAAAELPADVAAAAAAEDDVDDGQVEGCWVRSCPDCRRARQLQPTLRKDEERRQQQQQQQQQEQKSQEQQQQQQPSLVTDPKDDANTLAQVCWSKADHLVRQSALFLSSDAAKQFLTRQLSWVTGSSELDDEPAENSPREPAYTFTLGGSPGDTVKRPVWRHRSTGSEDDDRPVDGGGSRSAPATSENSPLAPPRLLRQVMERSGLWRRHASSLSLDSATPTPASPPAPAEVDRMVAEGRRLLDTSVWTWGRADASQLGLGDGVSRSAPTPLTTLTGVGVRKLVAGRRHALALTIDGRAYAWGDNGNGQVCPTSSKESVSTPQEVVLPAGTTVRDAAAGAGYSLLLTATGDVFYLSRPQAVRLQLEQDVGLLGHRVWASGSVSCCLSRPPSKSSASSWIELVVSEQLFLRTCCGVAQTVLTQLTHPPTDASSAASSDSAAAAASSSSSSSVAEARRRLATQHRRLVAALAFGVDSLAADADAGAQLALVRRADDLIHLFRRYAVAACDALVVNALTLTKTESVALEKLWPGLADLVTESKSAGGGAANPFQMAMLEPIGRLKDYAFHLRRLADSVKSNEDASGVGHQEAEDRPLLLEASRRYEEASRQLAAKCQSAEQTRLFWETCSPAKLTEALRTPERRLLRESRSQPMTVLNSGRFSTHWFILLSDVLVHVGYSGHATYPLATIWVDAVPDSSDTAAKDCLTLMMPEENLTLTCPTATEKIEWVCSLQLAIKQALNMDTMSLASRTSPPKERRAAYTFGSRAANAALRDATYTGWWLCAEMHGQGRLSWPDGRTYEGRFQHNVQCGFGVGHTPPPNGADYTGYWSRGKMNGYGVLKYSNGDVYEGYLKDDLPHGHGTLKRGHFLTSAAHVYVGQWENGQKHGYGVMDDVTAGEKYMGMWMADAKHGSAVLVTLDGLYIEGCFNNNKMTGQCIMLLDDGTSYEGEVAGVGVLGGKGVLRLPNGHQIHGTFHGSWNEGVKMNAILTKGSATTDKPPLAHFDAPSIPGQFCVAGQRKWEAIFRLCCQALDIPLVASLWTTEHGRRAWDKIAVAMTRSKKRHQHHQQPQQPPLGHSTSSVSNLHYADILQRIPDYGRTSLDVAQYRQLEQYLQKALECEWHPLGRMVGHLVDVYRATYIGVGAHARLLPHAVAEVHSFVSRIYAFVRLLFPALPPEDRPCHLNADGPASAEDKEALLVSASRLLLPLLLPRVYPPLFQLYALHNDKPDGLYWDRLQKWNRQTDSALMNFLGVDVHKFYVDADSGRHFSGAVDCLQQLSTNFSPGEKLQVIQNTFQEINAGVQARLQGVDGGGGGGSYLWNMDDLLPVFQFVVVRSRIRHLGAEIHLIDDLLERHAQSGELDIMFTTLKACYYHIRQEKMNVN